GRYKLYRNQEGAQLYDLEADPGETRDVAADRKDAFERLDRAREDWNKELMPPRFEGLAGARRKKK
ncbi:MAG: N-acetylgalactosamine 6-sulfate sulfatase, partial [Acidobacteriota bacterium]